MEISKQYVIDTVKSRRGEVSVAFQVLFIAVVVTILWFLGVYGVGTGKEALLYYVFVLIFAIPIVFMLIDDIYRAVQRHTLNEIVYVRCFVDGVQRVHDKRHRLVKIYLDVLGHSVLLNGLYDWVSSDDALECYVFFGNGHVLFAMPVFAGEVVGMEAISQEMAMNYMKWW